MTPRSRARCPRRRSRRRSRRRPAPRPPMEQAVDRFLAGLRVQPVRNSQLIALTFESDRAALAARAANALAELYIEQTLDFRYRVSAEAGAWLDQETAEHTRKVSEAQRALQEFQDREGLGDIDERRALLEQKLKDLGAALNAAKTRRLDKEALSRQMQATGNAEELPDVVRNPLVQSLRTELGALERQQQQLAQRYLDEHPEVVKVRRQVEDTRAKIAAEARQGRARGRERHARGPGAGGRGRRGPGRRRGRGARAVAPRREVRRAEAGPHGQPAPVGEPAGAAEADRGRARGARLERARDRRGGGAAVAHPAAAGARPGAHGAAGAGGGARGRVRCATTSTARSASRRTCELLGQSLLGVIPEAPKRSREPGVRRRAGGVRRGVSRVLRTAPAARRPRRRAGPAGDLDARGRGQEPHRPEPGEDARVSSDERVLLVDADLRRPAAVVAAAHPARARPRRT